MASSKQHTRARTSKRNTKQSIANDVLLVNAALIEQFGDSYESNPHAWNVKLRYLGNGADDDRISTKYFCVECGWRMFLDKSVYRCSNWPKCKCRCDGHKVKVDRGKSHQARQKSLAEARITERKA